MMAAVRASVAMETASMKAPGASGVETCTSVLIVPKAGVLLSRRAPTLSALESPTVATHVAVTAPTRDCVI